MRNLRSPIEAYAALNHLEFWSGLALVFVSLWEAFETMILPRAIMRPGRVTHVFYRSTHWLRRAIVLQIPSRTLRETLLAAYGPLSLLVLVILWATLIVVGFGLIHLGLGTHFTQSGDHSFGTIVYFSGSTFFTLGYGDLTPAGALARALAVAEAGLGFGMLASVIGYLPVLYQAFSNREAAIVRFANRCGGTIDGMGLIGRYARNGNYDALTETLENIEAWMSELLETTVSYPMLAFYRSQREDRSWIGAVTAVLDATVVLQLDAKPPWPTHLVDQAELTFSMARRTLEAMTKALHRKPDLDRRRPFDFDALTTRLARSGVTLAEGSEERMQDLMRRYEPEADCLARFLSLDLPSWPSVSSKTS